MKPETKRDLTALLQRLEWSQWSEGRQKCPVCREAQKYGHDSECELSRMLRLLTTNENHNETHREPK